MEAEADPTTEHDFNLYQEVAKGIKEPVGVGSLMTGANSGLIRIEWDLFGAKDIYVDLSFKTNRGSALKAA